MGKENNILCNYLNDRERFADLFNGSFFGGRQVVKPGDLMEMSGVYTGQTPNGTHTYNRTRDLIKQLKNGISLKVVAVEAQDYIDYSMPWRCMNYDAHEYEKQLHMIKQKNRMLGRYEGRGEFLGKVRKTDLLAPVYTLCLYHGVEQWDGPRTLRDMMDFGDDRELWEGWFADYPFHLVCINEWKDCSLFRTPLSELFRMLPYRNDKAGLSRLLDQHPEYRRLDEETAGTLGQLMGVENFMKNQEQYKEEDKYNMCQALRELMEDSRNEGRTEGRTEVILDFLGESGDIPADLRKRIQEEKNLEKLNKWIKAAAQAASVDEFREKMG